MAHITWERTAISCTYITIQLQNAQLNCHLQTNHNGYKRPTTTITTSLAQPTDNLLKNLIKQIKTNNRKETQAINKQIRKANKLQTNHPLPATRPFRRTK